MTRRVFFSFHFDDSWRANQVRNANVLGGVNKDGVDVAGFYDHSLYEEIKRGDAGLEREILAQLEGTSVTVVLIGSRTADRPWVNFEIRESVKRDNGLVGIRIHHLIAPPNWRSSPEGAAPPALPPGTPIYIWDPKKREGFARVIDQAAQRGDRLREAKKEGQRIALLKMKEPPEFRPNDARRILRSMGLSEPPPAPPPEVRAVQSDAALEALLMRLKFRR
jgi:hypothetical protein